MKRTATGLCVAVAFGCIATLGAQTPPPAGQRTSTADKAKEVTISGCLAKGADGKYTLTNARMDNPMAGSTATGTSGTARPTHAAPWRRDEPGSRDDVGAGRRQ